MRTRLIAVALCVFAMSLGVAATIDAQGAAPHLAQINTPASFPYYTGFESGALGSEWAISLTNEGRVQVSTSYPYTGTYSLLLDDALGNATLSSAAAILSVDLGGQSQVELDFWWREFTDENHAEDGVFISDDDGAHWSPLFSFNNGPQFWRHQVLDLDAAATAQGLTLNDHFQIKFQFYDSDPIPSDGYAIDEVRVRAPHVPVPANFPYYSGFESGALGAEWITDFTYEGRVQVSSSYVYTGAYSLLLDDARGDTTLSNAAAILSVDLSGQSQVELDFWWREFIDENHTEDGVFISDDNGAHWSPLFSFNNGPQIWRHQVLDLDAAAAAQGLTLNDHFQIKFQFYDSDPIPSDGYAIDEVRVRPNAAPILAWTGDTNYQQDGLHPESGDVGDAYIYRIMYVDTDADPPGFVRVHIQKGAVDIAGSPFTMNCAAGDYALGVTCAYTRTGLNVGADYTYLFAAGDDQGNPAAPTAPIDAQDVTITYRVYLPPIMKNAGPPAGAPTLNAINNPGGDYKFTVSWSAVNLATRYTLQEDDNAAFSSPTTVYVGSGLSKLVYVQAVGTYYYRVNASNAFGESSWSNTQAVLVTVTPPPCPATGAWSGAGNRFSISYQVAQSGNACRVQSVTGHLSAYCHGSGQNWSMYVELVLPMATISNQQFYTSDGDTQVRGTFTTPTTVEGTWSYYYVFPYPPATCSGSGTWTGSH